MSAPDTKDELYPKDVLEPRLRGVLGLQRYVVLCRGLVNIP